MCICCQQRTTLINMGSVHRAGRTRTSSMVIQNSHFVNTTMHHSNFFSVFHKKEPHFALFFADDSMRVHNKSLPPFWGKARRVKKASPRKAVRRRQINFKSFSAGACTWQKILLRLRSLAPQRCAERNRRRRLLARSGASWPPQAAKERAQQTAGPLSTRPTAFLTV